MSALSDALMLLETGSRGGQSAEERSVVTARQLMLQAQRCAEALRDAQLELADQRASSTAVEVGAVI
jgi:hypothetical protein